MSFLGELKRRNVFRVGAAYLVTAWLLIEIGSLMFDAFGFPDWAAQLLIMVLGLGLIPIVFFAWAYELTPEGIKRESEVDRSSSITPHTGHRLDQITIVMILLALGVIMVDNFVLEKGVKGSGSIASPEDPVIEPDPFAPTEETEPAFEPDPNSVAVLPFVNMSADPENEYFSDGISEELLNLLVRIEGLRVPSRTSSFAFKGRNTDIREIAKTLDVAHVLEGSVRKAGDQVRITAQLIDVKNDAHVWSETYDRRLTDIFAIQDEIANSIIESLQIALGTAEPAPRREQTENFEAYDLYLQGLHLFRQREEKLLESERLLRQAVERDPDFADAWATLALVYVVQPYYVEITREEARPKAMEAADRALALNPDLADPRAVKALLFQWDFRWVKALELFDALVTDHPSHALSRMWYGIVLLETGYIDRAQIEMKAAYKLDPASGVAVDWMSKALMMDGEAERSLKLAKRALKLDRLGAYGQLAQYYLLQGEHDEYMASLIEAPAESRPALEAVAMGLKYPERRAEAIEICRQSRGGAYYEAQLYALLGDAEGFFPALRKAIEIDESSIGFVWYPASKPLRQHPLMHEFVRDYRLLEAWQEHGWPDDCRPAGEDDFECE